eukprot:PhF_6_TR8335/c0_g1_i3/m.13022
MPFLTVRNVITLLFAALIFTTAAVTLGLTLSFSINAIQDIGIQHADALATKAKTQVEAFLSQPLGQLRGLQDATMFLVTPLPNETYPSDPMWYKAFFRRLISDMSAVHFAYQFAVLGFNDGNYIGCKRGTTPDIINCRAFLWAGRALSSGKTSTVVDEFYNTTQRQFTKTTSSTTTYDPRTRVWFRLVDHIPLEMTWSPVYLSAMPTLPIVDVNAAIFNSSNALIAIASYTFELDMMSRSFLPSLRTTKNTYCGIIDNGGLLMATTHPQPYLTETVIPLNFNG